METINAQGDPAENEATTTSTTTYPGSNDPNDPSNTDYCSTSTTTNN